MNINSIVIHHSASSPETTIQQINEWHKARGFNKSDLGYYVGYHYLIAADGVICQTRDDVEIGCHCVPNTGKIGICLIGDFTKTKPTNEQINALNVLLDNLTSRYILPPQSIYVHRELKATECPGDPVINWVKLYRRLGSLRDQIRILLARIAAKKETYTG